MHRTLGDFIREKREALGMNQTELWRASGVPRETINRLENNKTQLPFADSRRRLAKALNVRHVDLLVAAGELTEDEIDPDIPQYTDPTMDALAQTWPHLDEDRREDLIRYVNRLLEPVSNIRVLRREETRDEQ